MKTLIVGDIHGKFKLFNRLIEFHKPDIVLTTGDIGIFKEEEFDDILPKNTKVYLTFGNHDNWEISDFLDKDEITEVRPNLFYQPRGSIITLSDGRTVLSFGGAKSLDKDDRIQGLSWWPGEDISYTDIDRFMNKPLPKIDIMVAHQAPSDFKLPKYFGSPLFSDRSPDSNREALSVVYNRAKPSLYFFSHWHKSHSGKHNDTYYHCLNMAELRSKSWWRLI